jgi:hypothetical protein
MAENGPWPDALAMGHHRAEHAGHPLPRASIPGAKRNQYRSVGFNVLAIGLSLAVSPLVGYLPGYVIASTVKAAGGPWISINLADFVADRNDVLRIVTLSLCGLVPLFVFDFFSTGTSCAYRRSRPPIPTDRDHLFRSIATSVARVLTAPLDDSGDVSLLKVGQARREAVPVVNRRDPGATRSALTAGAAARAGGPC